MRWEPCGRYQDLCWHLKQVTALQMNMHTLQVQEPCNKMMEWLLIHVWRDGGLWVDVELDRCHRSG